MKILLIIMLALMTSGCGGVYSLSQDDRELMINALHENQPIVLMVHDVDEKQNLYGLKRPSP
ncbi:MAG: hypothetical protein HZA16_00050 [Nitrospirae bacterium]|nr:hypothetical protein [Nitrospirota bacterium]